MTMGQRIAERRKLLGLSQEALGEKMGVSRQAIYKWESDAAIPDVDKLIGLSKLFSVTVGWLLGTEESCEGDSTGGIREDQMKTIEELIRRYTRPEEKKVKPWMGLVLGIALGLGLLSLILSLHNLTRSNQLFSGYNSQLGSLSFENQSIQSQLSNMNSRLQQLVEGETLVTDFSFSLSALADYTGAEIRFWATAREGAEGDTAYLSVKLDGREVSNVACEREGLDYSAELTLPAQDGYSYYFLLCHGDGTREQTLLLSEDVGDDTTPVYLKSILKLRVGADLDRWSWSQNVLKVDPFLWGEAPGLIPEGQALPRWSRVELVLTRNGTELSRRDCLGEVEAQCRLPGTYEAEKYMESLWFNCSLGWLDFELPALSAGDTLELWIEGELSNGLTGRYIVQSWRCTENGLEDF